MSTRRARKHKELSHFGRVIREHVNEVNKGGLFDKQLNKLQCNPYKFRRRAFFREKELENESLKKKAQPLGLLQFVTAPFEPDRETKEDDHDD